VIAYTLVVNRAAGVDRLTTQQVKDIFSGRVRNRDQVRPGPSVPIGIVGRGQESGTRKTFERKVLGGAEDRLTSDSCRKPERDPSAATTRCERGTTAEVLTEVSAVPGAIGYADVTTIGAGYRFWTVECLTWRARPRRPSCRTPGTRRAWPRTPCSTPLHQAGHLMERRQRR
jgi:hypothetical protein